MIVHLNQTDCPPKRVVCLGAHGFIGAKFVEFIKSQGIDCIGFGYPELDLTKPESVDLLVREIRSDDSVIMFSALTPDKGKGYRIFFQNMKMIEHVAHVVEKTSLAHFTYMSTDAIYAEGDDVLHEKSPCDPADFYALMHYSREKMIQGFMQQLNKPLVILRMCAVFGIGDTHGAYGPNRFVKTAVLEKKIKLFGEGEEIRDHLWVEDAIQWIASAVQKKSSGICNLVSGQGRSFLEVAQIIQRLCPHEVALEKLPRQIPIIHKRYEDRVVRTAFLERAPTSFEKVIHSMIQFELEQTKRNQ